MALTIPQVVSSAIPKPEKGEHITIRCATTGILITRLPRRFVKRSGLNSWSFVFNLLGLLPNVDPSAILVIYQADQIPINPTRKVWSGIFDLVQIGRGSSSYVSPQIVPLLPSVPSTPLVDIWLDEAVHGTPEGKFIESIMFRDGRCLVSGVEFTECIVARMIPLNRPDIYQKLVGMSNLPSLYDISMGLMLRIDLGHAFERYEWSLFLQAGFYYAHFFDLNTPLAHKFHGKSFDICQFRAHRPGPPSPPSLEEIPDPRLLT